MQRHHVTAAALAVLFLIATLNSIACAAPYTFTPLGDLPGGVFFSRAYAVSADGSVVVGRGTPASGAEAFLWTSGGGMVGLGALASGFSSFGWGVSADGSVVVGQSGGASEAFRWTSGGGMVGLGDLPGGSVASQALGVSGDGSVVVGQSISSNGNEAFRWTNGGGMVGLGDLPGGNSSSFAYGVSTDGSVIVWRSDIAGGVHSFRSSSGCELVGLGDLPGGSYFSHAYDVSADGAVVVGRGTSGSGTEAFRWTSGGGMVGLGDLPGGSFDSLALGVSGDGSVVVGRGNGALGPAAFVWTSGAGMQNLRDMLIAGGATGLTGWILDHATDISADGKTIVGKGINPLGEQEAWVATVLEPSTIALAAVASAGALACARRRRKRTSAAVAALLCAALLLGSSSASAVTIPTVPVGNAGNAGEVQSQGTFGAVAYDYRIGTTEVTLGQYTVFLNAVAATDTYSLYNTSMATNLNIAGISRSGSSGSYTYSVIGSANKPVVYVGWGDAARFANWLHNGQPTGVQDASTTEDGAYTLNGANSNAALNTVSRTLSATWFIPSENEWYKAAYHKNDGATGNYWDYPTSTDSTPYSDQPPGSGAPTQSNTVNFYKDDSIANGYDDGYAVTGSTSNSSSQNYLTDAGAYSLSASPYGTYDQGGNVYEWNEARALRGGAWDFAFGDVDASSRRGFNQPTNESSRFGFRVATVPEPTSFVLAALAIAGLIFLSGRRAVANGGRESSRRCSAGRRAAARSLLATSTRAALPVLVCLFVAVEPSHAAPITVVDQQNPGPFDISFSPPSPMGQTFTASLAGVDAIEVDLRSANTVYVNLRDGLAGADGLTGPILATSNTVSYVIPTVQTVHFDFASTIPLIPGNTYVAELVSTLGADIDAVATTSNAYTGGQSLMSGFASSSSFLLDRDLLFVEGLHVPEPSTFVLAAFALLGVATLARRRRMHTSHHA